MYKIKVNHYYTLHQHDDKIILIDTFNNKNLQKFRVLINNIVLCSKWQIFELNNPLF